jgi:hypothetical protein
MVCELFLLRMLKATKYIEQGVSKRSYFAGAVAKLFKKAMRAEISSSFSRPW